MKLAVASVICLWLAAGCQQALAPHLAIGSVMPDFPLIAVGVLGMFCTRRGGSVLGFFAGLVTGAISGASMAGYIVSRTLAGFVIGWFTDLEFEAGAVMSVIATAFLTLAAELIRTFVAPPPASAFLDSLGATIGIAVVNGVLAMPFYAIMRAILSPPRNRI